MAETTDNIPASDPLFSSAETGGNGSNSSPSAHDERSDEAERLRGVVALPHDRPILLTDEVEFGPGALPRWRPQINLDSRHMDAGEVE
jgi:hypothetical protein